MSFSSATTLPFLGAGKPSLSRLVQNVEGSSPFIPSHDTSISFFVQVEERVRALDFSEEDGRTLAEQRMCAEAIRGPPFGSRTMVSVGQRKEGGKVTGAFRTFFMLVGVSAIVVVVFLIVASAM